MGLTVEIPLDKVSLGNLTKLLEAKGKLIRKALGITDLRIEVLDDRVVFPCSPRWTQIPQPPTPISSPRFAR